MKRLREISTFECDIRVLRNGFCEFLDARNNSYTITNTFQGDMLLLKSLSLAMYMRSLILL